MKGQNLQERVRELEQHLVTLAKHTEKAIEGVLNYTKTLEKRIQEIESKGGPVQYL